MISSIVEAIGSHSLKNGKKICLIDNDLRLSYSDFFSHIYGYCSYLKSKGVGKGDHVLVRASQTATYFISGAAIQLSGAIFVPVEKRISAHNLDNIIRLTKSNLLISDIDEDVDIDVLRLSDSLGHKTEIKDYSDVIYPKSEDIAEVLFTTGTTGKSKGVIISHANNIALAQNVVDGTKMEINNVEIIPGPYSHSMTLRRYYANMYNGSCVVTANGVTFIDHFFKSVERNKVTSMNLAPAFLSMIFNLSGDKIGEYKDQLKYIQIGGSIFPQSDKDRLSKLLPHTRLYDFYGCTEAGCACTYDFNEHKDYRNCVGKATINSTFKFVDENGNEVSGTKESPGFLLYGGGQSMIGYFKDPELTERTMMDGLIMSKDLAYRDSEDNIYILGRKDDIINMGGIKISPEEIESVARIYENVEECVCVPAKDSLMGEVPKLFIKVKDRTIIDLKDFKKYLAGKVDQSKMPKHFKFIDEIPMTYNGKIKRRDLIDM